MCKCKRIRSYRVSLKRNLSIFFPSGIKKKKGKRRKDACSILRFVRVLSFYLVIRYYIGVCEVKTNARDSASKRPKLVYSPVTVKASSQNAVQE